MSQERELVDNSDLPIEEDFRENMRTCFVYDTAQEKEGDCPSQAHASVVYLNGRLGSDLNWAQSLTIARRMQQENRKILFDLDLGLFSDLKQPLNHTIQYTSLVIAIQQFREEVWPEFKTSCLGVILYRGPLDFSCINRWDDRCIKDFFEWSLSRLKAEGVNYSHLIWTEAEWVSSPQSEPFFKIYCRNVCMDYIDLLASYLPAWIKPWLLLDATGLSPLSLVQLADEERLDRYWLGLQSACLPLNVSTWNQGKGRYGYIGHSLTQETFLIEEEAKLALCFPSTENFLLSRFEGLYEVLESLQRYQIPFRIVFENRLNMEWEGIEELIVSGKGITSSCLRKLHGFVAAMGKLIYIGAPLGCADEIAFEDWLILNRSIF